MKRFINIAACTIAIILSLAVSSCQSDEPGAPNTDYGKMRIGRMNLTGAKHLALKTGNNSRAIDGEYLSSGLYKVDANGNISAVGIYFTTDTLGNRLEKEYALRIAPRKLFQLTSNYMLATDCEYYDVDGDIVRDKWIEIGNDDEDIRLIKQEVPYKHLLVRLTDGKVWCVDNIIKTIANVYVYPSEVESVKGIFKETPDGVLYQKNVKDVYKYNLTNDNPSFEQVVVFPSHGAGLGDNLQIVSNGVLWHYLFQNGEIEFAWPHSGFQVLSGQDLFDLLYKDKEVDLSSVKEDLKLEYEFYSIGYVSVGERPFVILTTNLVSHYHLSKDKYDKVNDWIYENKLDMARFVELGVSDTPGGVKPMDNYLKLEATRRYPLANWDFDRNKGYYVSSVLKSGNYIITSDNRDHSMLTLIDMDKHEWRWFKQLDFRLDFTGGWSEIYRDRFYTLNFDQSNFGTYWFDINTLEDGFTPFNVQLPDYISINSSDLNCNDGVIKFSGRNPATGDIDYIYINITTGEATHETSKIEMIFETLISLS